MFRSPRRFSVCLPKRKRPSESSTSRQQRGHLRFLPVKTITEEPFHAQFNLNVLGRLLVTQKAVRKFGPEGGSIVNISSVVAPIGCPQAFHLPRHQGRGVKAITKSLAKESDQKRFASTRSTQEWSRPKAFTAPVSSVPTFKKCSRRKRPLGASASPMTSGWSPSSVWMSPAGYW